MARTIARWQPFADLADVRARFDRLFADLADGEHGAYVPEVDVVESPEKLVVNMNVPGIKPEEIKVEVEDDLLTISGEHTEETEETGKRYVRRERRHGSFSRTIALPDTANRDEVDATCHDGVLSITIPLAEAPKHEARTITPKAA
jgi:HSP20 family protein